MKNILRNIILICWSLSACLDFKCVILYLSVPTYILKYKNHCFALFLRALRDADKAISIASDWPKGYFRKGRALAGLKVSNHETAIPYDIP